MTLQPEPEKPLPKTVTPETSDVPSSEDSRKDPPFLDWDIIKLPTQAKQERPTQASAYLHLTFRPPLYTLSSFSSLVQGLEAIVILAGAMSVDDDTSPFISPAHFVEIESIERHSPLEVVMQVSEVSATLSLIVTAWLGVLQKFRDQRRQAIEDRTAQKEEALRGAALDVLNGYVRGFTKKDVKRILGEDQLKAILTSAADALYKVESAELTPISTKKAKEPTNPPLEI